MIRASILPFIDPGTTPTEAFSPLSLEQFTHFVLIPNISRHFITEDLDITPMEAFEEMAASGDVGKFLQELDDTGVDDVLDNITMKAVADSDQKRKARGVKKVMQVEDAAVSSTRNRQRPKPKLVTKPKVCFSDPLIGHLYWAASTDLSYICYSRSVPVLKM